MNPWILLAITMTAYLGGDILRKWFMGRHGDAQWKVFAFNTVSSVVSFFVLLIWCGVKPTSTFTFCLALVFGTVTALQAIATMKALQTGPMSYSNVIISSSTLITALSGYFFFGETIEWPQYVGIALMFISFFLAIEKDKNGKSASLRWMAFCLLAFCCSGGVGIMQKTESTHHKDELGTFLVLAFVVATLFSAVMTWILWSKEKKAKTEDGKTELPLFEKNGWKTLLIPGCMILMGISAAVNNQLNLSLSGRLPSAVFFPVVNGGALVLSSLAAVLIFREKLSVRRWIGVAIGTASVILLCNPFR